MKKFSFLVAFVLSIAAAHAQIITPAVPNGDAGALPGGRAAGRFYYPLTAANPGNVSLTAANRLFATPMFMSAASTLKSLSFDIGTGNAAAWNARMCVYADNGSGAPGALMADSGTVAIASGSVTGIQTATLPGGGVSIGPGWVWLAFMADSNAESLFSYSAALAGVSSPISSILGNTTLANIFGGSAVNSVYMAQTFGACPANFGAVTLNAAAAAPFIVAGF